MKINKQDPKHWLYLVVGGTNVLIASIARRVTPKSKVNRVVFTGHTFNGNLLALAEYIEKNVDGFKCFFATLDFHYYKQLKDEKIPAEPLNILNIWQTIKMVRSSAVITDRNSGVVELANCLTDLPFIDVWHGIPFKGYTHKNFEYLKPYCRVLTSSKGIKQTYINYGVDAKKIKATGYARTDALANGAYDVSLIKAKYNISSKYKSIVLVAPTWQQDDKGRSIVPFGVSENEFFEYLNKVGKKTNSLFIFRAHLNVLGIKSSRLSNVVSMPYALYPIAEEFLAISDILISDWSSIVFDYLVLRRPTIFLDVPMPFKDGFTVNPKHRFGEVVSDIDALLNSITTYLKSPEVFSDKYSKKMDDATKFIYDSTLDGRVCERQYKQLEALLNKNRRT